ncbi:MAG: hypothetical protein ACLRYY_07940 [Anaerobutyricum soehngenii]
MSRAGRAQDSGKKLVLQQCKWAFKELGIATADVSNELSVISKREKIASNGKFT